MTKCRHEWARAIGNRGCTAILRSAERSRFRWMANDDAISHADHHEPDADDQRQVSRWVSNGDAITTNAGDEVDHAGRRWTIPVPAASDANRRNQRRRRGR